ncbi:MAG: ribosome maturation factor RimP [Alphaproteobacteria bacterium]|nr:ribosome maturation factor RimP [Alphaproteobacteria bacterium]
MAAPGALEELLTPPLQAMGYEVVRILLTGGRNPTLQIMADRLDGKPMTVDDCTAISRDVSAILDVEDPIEGAYVLEVSSPGIDRPLTKLVDFERFKGFEARVELKLLTDGRRRFKARIVGTGPDDKITFEVEGERFDVDFSLVQKAKLVMTDDLIAARAAEAAGSEQTVEGSPVD